VRIDADESEHQSLEPREPTGVGTREHRGSRAPDLDVGARAGEHLEFTDEVLFRGSVDESLLVEELDNLQVIAALLEILAFPEDLRRAHGLSELFDFRRHVSSLSKYPVVTRRGLSLP